MGFCFLFLLIEKYENLFELSLPATEESCIYELDSFSSECGNCVRLWLAVCFFNLFFKSLWRNLNFMRERVKLYPLRFLWLLYWKVPSIFFFISFEVCLGSSDFIPSVMLLHLTYIEALQFAQLVLQISFRNRLFGNL